MECKHRTETGYCRLHSEKRYRAACVDGPCPDDTSVHTNGDRIRAMNDEELAIWLMEERDSFCRNDPACDEMLNQDRLIPRALCRACALAWLQKTYEEKTK